MTDTMILEPETEDVSQIETEEINDIQQRIQERAYELFVERGFEHGHDLEDWLQAEVEITATVDDK